MATDTSQSIVELVQRLGLKRRAGARRIDIERVETSLGVVFPRDYVALLGWSDGFEGKIGAQYLSLWRVSEIVPLNHDYDVRKYLPGVIAIGTDGGDDCFGLDTEAASFVRVPLGDLDATAVVQCAVTLEEAIRSWAEG